MTPCRNCGLDLPPAFAFLGICAWCVAESMHAPAEMPRPRYGPDEADEDSEAEPDLDLE
jgi:hypothetical protein